MGSAWLISVIMRFTSNGARIMSEMAGSTSRANTMLDAHKAKLAEATAALEAYRLKMLQIGTTVSGVLALAGAAFIGIGVKLAADLQTAMVGVNIRTLGQDPRGMQDLVERVANMTAQNQITIANELAVMATSIHDPEELKARFPLIAKAADIAFLSTGADPVETTKQLTFFAHMFTTYRGPKFDEMINSAIKLLAVQPEGLPIMTRQMKYFVGIANALHVPMDQIFESLMNAGQLGLLRGRSGSGIGMAMARSATAYNESDAMPKNLRAGLKDLGAYDQPGHLKWIHRDPQTGKQVFDFYGPGGMMDFLAKREQEMTPTSFIRDVREAFQASASQILTILAQPGFQEQMRKSKQAFDKMPDIEAQFKLYSKTLAFQWREFVTNFQGVMIDIFTPMLGHIARFFFNMQTALAKFGQFLRDHPEIAKNIAELSFAFVGLTGARFVMGMLTLGRMAMAMPAIVSQFAGSLSGLTESIVANSAAIRGQAIANTVSGVGGMAFNARTGAWEKAGGGLGAKLLLWLDNAGLLLLGVRLSPVIKAIGSVGARMLGLRASSVLFEGALGRIAARMIPVVGWMLLLAGAIDTMAHLKPQDWFFKFLVAVDTFGIRLNDAIGSMFQTAWYAMTHPWDAAGAVKRWAEHVQGGFSGLGTSPKGKLEDEPIVKTLRTLKQIHGAALLNAGHGYRQVIHPAVRGMLHPFMPTSAAGGYRQVIHPAVRGMLHPFMPTSAAGGYATSFLNQVNQPYSRQQKEESVKNTDLLNTIAKNTSPANTPKPQPANITFNPILNIDVSQQSLNALQGAWNDFLQKARSIGSSTGQSPSVFGVPKSTTGGHHITTGGGPMVDRLFNP